MVHGRRQKIDYRDDRNGLRLPGAKKPPGAIRTALRVIRDGRSAKRQAAKTAARQEYSMAMNGYDPKISVQKGNGQALNTAGSGTFGIAISGIVYAGLPGWIDDETRKIIAAGLGAGAAVLVSWVAGWWRNRQKHKEN